jgi:hypothetical protein
MNGVASDGEDSAGSCEGAVGPQRGAFWNYSALVLIAVAFLVVLATFGDYGTTWDEDYHFWYGFKVVAYYGSFFRDTTALTSPPISYYGALFDATAALLAPISPLGYYTTRHLLNALVGIAGLVGCWKLGREIGGPRVGFCALIALLLTPNYYGQIFNNPKDVPFAAGYVWSLYYLVRILPAFPLPPRRDVLKLGLAIGLTLAIRVGGLLLLCYLVMALASVCVLRLRGSRQLTQALAELATATRRVVAPVLVLAYALMLAAWPWAQPDPLWRPIAALIQFGHHDFPYNTLFDGTYYPAPDLPRSYLPVFFLIQLPELTVLLLAAGVVCVPFWIWRTRPPPKHLLVPALVIFAALFPIGFAVATHAILFDGMRHFLFVEPPLICCAALAFDAALRWLRPRRAAFAAATAALALYFVHHIALMVELHPDEYVYYNAFVGGVPGAAGRYKLDYWANSYREAAIDLVGWLKARDGAHFDTNHYRVAACGPPGSIMPYLPRNLQYEADRTKADFYIAFTKDKCDKSIVGQPIAEVARLGTRLTVVLDLHPLNLAKQEK